MLIMLFLVWRQYKRDENSNNKKHRLILSDGFFRGIKFGNQKKKHDIEKKMLHAIIPLSKLLLS